MSGVRWPSTRSIPTRSEFTDSPETGRGHQSLEDALHWARWTILARWRETNKYGLEGEYVHDAETAVITNRDTGYRWILRRREWVVEFQTLQMLEESIAEQGIDVHLTIEEAEALARVAKAAPITDKRIRALTEQALDQIAALSRQVRERVRVGDTFIDAWTQRIPRRIEPEPQLSQTGLGEEPIDSPRPRYRPLGDPDNLSLKEAGERRTPRGCEGRRRCCGSGRGMLVSERARTCPGKPLRNQTVECRAGGPGAHGG
jgi:hypothetical protein